MKSIGYNELYLYRCGDFIMSRGKNQKMKLYHLRDIMLKKTDSEHEITLSEIKNELEKRDVTAERKSLYNDIADLKDLGVEIVGTQKNNSYYYKVIKRDFELAELKLLVDAIQSSKFITVVSFILSILISTLAGIPSIIAVNFFPWDSPDDKNLKFIMTPVP